MTTAKELLGKASRLEELRAEIESINAELETALRPYISRWHKQSPVPCHHDGGWSLDVNNEDWPPIDPETGMVRLIHDCFYAHRYDLHNTYSIQVSLERLTSSLYNPEPEPVPQ